MIPLVIAAAGVHPLATTNAVLNAVATVLLIAGWSFIKRGKVRAHRAAMMSAFAVSTVFLACYLTYHALVGHVPFGGKGGVRTVYLAILISHIFLAVAVPVLAVAMFVLAWKGRWNAHRRLGRVALPIWLYVSVTGVVIYLMLYHFFPGPAHASTLKNIRLTWFAGSGAAKVAASRSFGLSPGEDTPKAPRAFADPLRLPALAYVGNATHELDAL